MKKTKNNNPRLFLKIIGLFFLSIIGFVLFTTLSYPLKPHCNLGNGIYGCTPQCEAIGFFADGRPSNYKEVPCFHADATKIQVLVNQNIMFIIGGFLLLAAIWFFVNKKTLLNSILWIVFGPFKVIKQNLKNKKIISKIFIFVAVIPLILIWLFGYFFVGNTLSGDSFNAKLNEQTVNQSDEIHIITNKKSCDEQWSLANAKNCTALVIRDDGGHGTSFSVQNGYLITNKHVIEGAKKLTTWYKGEEIELKVWNYSPVFDLAILKTPVNTPTCSWFSSSNIDLAETLYAVGWPNNPSGESTVTKGIYSRTNKFDDGMEFIQTDAPINPGSSGGPLINKCGVIGINTLKESWSNEQLQRPLEGLSNALSSDSIIEIIKKLIEDGGDVEIPKSNNVQQNKIQPSTPITKLDLTMLQNHLTSVIEARISWNKNADNCSTEKLDTLNDLFNRQIEFSKTLIDKIQNNNNKVTNDDLIMWDAIVKMSYESSSIAKELNSTCAK